MNAEEWIRSLGNGDAGVGDVSTWRPSGGRLMRGNVLADSALQSFDALRAASAATERQMVLVAGSYVVALEFAVIDDPANECGDDTALRIVRGRADGPGVVAVQVVAPTGVEVALAVPDELGEFEFVIPTGQWVLVVSDDDHDVEVTLDVD